MNHTAIAIAQKGAEADQASERLSRAVAALNTKAIRLEKVVRDMVGLTYEGRKRD